MLRSFLSGLALALAFTVTVSAQTADEIITKHLQAIGGVEKIKAIKTMRSTGKLPVGPGIEAPITMEQSRPNSFRLDIQVQGMTITQAYDGATGWKVMPFGGKKDPEVMSDDELKDAKEMAEFDSDLVDYKEKGNKVELLGKESVEGSEAWKLKVTRKDGKVNLYFLDAESFLLIKAESKRMNAQGAEVESESVFGDYKEIDGVLYAHSIEQGPKGSQQKMKITLDKIEANPKIEATRFKMPAAPRPEPKAEEKKP